MIHVPSSATIPLLVVAACAYLLGGVPFGLLLTRAAGIGNLRQIGSGNIGATNVLRTGRRGLAAATLLLDGGKGGLAVWLAGVFCPAFPSLAQAVALFFVVLGHCLPVVLLFRGGKGVATGLGAALVLSPLTGAALLLIWLAVARLSRISSAGALAAFVALPVLLPLITTWPLYDPREVSALAVTALVVARHYGNIRRLLSGTESRVGVDAPAQAPIKL